MSKGTPGAVFSPAERRAYCVLCMVTPLWPGHCGCALSYNTAACSVIPPGAPGQDAYAKWSLLMRPETRVAWIDMLQCGIQPEASRRCHNNQ